MEKKMIRDEIRRSSLLHKEEFIKLVRDSYYLLGKKDNKTSQNPGVSRFGGLPDLPPGIEWPKWRGKSQSFIAQINLMELPPIPDRTLFPDRGMLYFFYDSNLDAVGDSPEERESYAVIYSEITTDQFQPRNIPIDLKEKEIFIPARISFEINESEPCWNHPLLKHLFQSYDERLVYMSILYDDNLIHENGHRMLGYPVPVQRAVALECELAQLGYWKAKPDEQEAIWVLAEKGAKDWELLLQVYSDNSIGMYYPPDCGILYYMIRRSDLLERGFDQTWMIKQFS